VNSLSDGVIVHAADRFIGCATSACHPPLRPRLCRRVRSTALPPSVPGAGSVDLVMGATGYEKDCFCIAARDDLKNDTQIVTRTARPKTHQVAAQLLRAEAWAEGIFLHQCHGRTDRRECDAIFFA